MGYSADLKYFNPTEAAEYHATKNARRTIVRSKENYPDDLEIDSVQNIIRRHTKFYDKRIHKHPNVPNILAMQLLEEPQIYRLSR